MFRVLSVPACCDAPAIVSNESIKPVSTQMRMSLPPPISDREPRAGSRCADVQHRGPTRRGTPGPGSETKDEPPRTRLRTTCRSNEPPSLFSWIRQVICGCPMPGTIGPPWRIAKLKTARMIDVPSAAGPTQLTMRPDGLWQSRSGLPRQSW